jgi:Ca2+-binding RTX toxin-like protein
MGMRILWGADNVSGGGSRDKVLGGYGNDTLWRQGDGLAGQNDVLVGGMEVDYLYGEGLDDLLVGYERAGSADHMGNNDYLYGSLGADRLIGQGGNDYLRCALCGCAGRPPSCRSHIAHSPRALGPGEMVGPWAVRRGGGRWR